MENEKRGRGRPKGSKSNPDGVKNVTLQSEAAKVFIEARDQLNERGIYPFPLTNSQFILLLVKQFQDGETK
tara:strand:- start:162 stop:374 length:213 start_codon:yes stop_codon:yes gene_type:complete